MGTGVVARLPPPHRQALDPHTATVALGTWCWEEHFGTPFHEWKMEGMRRMAQPQHMLAHV